MKIFFFRFFWLSLFLLSFIISFDASAQDGKEKKNLTIAITENYPPFAVLSPTGEVTGLFVEMWRLWSKETGTPIRFLITDWQGSLDSLRSGKADVHSGMFHSESRAKWIDFSESIHEIKTGLFFKTNGPLPRPLEEMAGSSVGAINGFYQLDYIREHYPDIKARAYQDGQALVLALLKGEVDAILNEIPAVEADLARFALRGSLTYSDIAFSNMVSAGVRKGDEELLTLINEGFEKIPVQDLARLEALWLPNSDNHFFADPEGNIHLTRQEEKWLADHPVIRIAVTTFINPIDVIDKEGKYSGLNADLIALLNQKLDTNIVPEFYDKWGNVVSSVMAGKVDAAFSLSRTPERERKVLFTKSYAFDPIIVVVPQTTNIVNSWEDLKDKRVVAVKGMAVLDDLKKILGEGTLTLAENEQSALKILETGEAQAFVGFLIPYGNAQRSHLVKDLRIVVTRNTEGGSMRLGVPKDRPELYGILRKGLNAITRQEIAQIRNHWLYPREQISIKLTDEERVWIEANPTWKVGNETDWPPFDFAIDGVPMGYSIDVIKLVAKNVGANLEFVNGFTWAKLLEKFKAGELDILPGVMKTDERLDYISFTKRYVVNPSVFVKHIDNTRKLDIDSLKGETVAVIKGDATDEILEKRYPEIKKILVENVTAGLQAVAAERADVFIGNLGTISHAMNKTFIPNIKIEGDVGLMKPEEMGLHIGVSKGRNVFLDIIQKGLNAINAEEKQKISKRWLAAIKESERLVDLTRDEQHWLKKHGSFSLGVDPSWAPFEFINDEDVYSGIGSSYINMVGNRLGITMTPKFDLSWAEVIEEAKSGNIDILPTVARTPKREQFLNFTNAYISFPMVITTRKDAPFVDSLTGLDGKKVGVVKDYISQELIEEHHKNIQVVPVQNLQEGLQQLNDRKIDAFVDNLLTITHAMDKSGLNDLKIAAPTQYKFELAMGVRKDLPELIPILNKALETISERDRAAIVNSWTAIQVQYGTDLKTILKWAIPVILIVIVIIFLIILWNRRLGREISGRKAIELKFKAMSNASHDAMIMINSKGIVMFWNTAAERMFEYTSEEVINKNMHSFFVPEEFRKPAHAGLKQFATSGKGPVIGSIIEQNALKRNGELFPVEIAISSFQLENEWHAVGFIRDITDRKKIETQIKAARKELLLIFDSSQIGIIFTHKKGEIARVNRRMTDILDYENPKSMIGINTRSLLFNDEQLQSFKTASSESLLQGKKAQLEYELRKSDGSPVWCSLSGKAVDTKQPPDLGKGVIWVVEDITQRRQMEDEIRKSEEDFRIIADYTYGWESWYNKNGALLWVNPAVERITGYSVEECHRQSSFPDSFVHPEDKDTFFELKNAALAGKEGNGVPFRIIHKTKEKEIWGEVSWNPVFDKQSLVTGYRTSVQNITDRKIAEKELQAKERRFRGFFENSLVGVTITHPDKGWIEINERFLEMLGYTRDELETLTWKDFSHPDDLQADLDQYDRMLKGEISHYSLDKRFLKKDGSIIYANIAVSCVRNSKGEIKMILGSNVDITEAKKTESEMKQYVADLEKFNQITISREERMIDLKDEVNHMLLQLGKENKYKIR